MTNTTEETQHVWPDLTIDQIAFQYAKIALGEGASLSDTLSKAQEIKAFLGQNKE